MYLPASWWCNLGMMSIGHLQSCCLWLWSLYVRERAASPTRWPQCSQGCPHCPEAGYTEPASVLNTEPSMNPTLYVLGSLHRGCLNGTYSLLMIDLWLNTGFSKPCAYHLPHCLGRFPGIHVVSPLNKVTGRSCYSPRIRKLRHSGVGATVWNRAVGLLRLYSAKPVPPLFFF